jgi:imidazole glycerol-phosphate synthase subunit HisF
VLKTRVIPILLVQDGLLKKRINFSESRTVANPLTIARVFEARNSDELFLLDIGRTVDKEHFDNNLVTQISEELFMPFAYGGGIKSVDEMQEVIYCGAEKVVINTSAIETPNLISDGAKKFGSQCIVVSIDAKKENNSFKVYSNSGQKRTNLNPVEWAIEVEKRGAGEILLNSIDHEGTGIGYNLSLIKAITDAVSIPVVAAGGVGKIEDVSLAVTESNASAVAIGSLFHYTHITPNMVKDELKRCNINVRI